MSTVGASVRKRKIDSRRRSISNLSEEEKTAICADNMKRQREHINKELANLLKYSARKDRKIAALEQTIV
jgi:flagellar motility protein MotE (MotC chaperone)